MRRDEIKQAFVSACNPRSLPHYDPEDEPTSCLSTDPHDETVEDAVQHYFGCLEISKRAEFLRADHPHWKHERDVQCEKYQLELSQAKEKYLLNTDKSKWESYLRGIQEKVKEAGHVVPGDVVATYDSLPDAKADLLLQELVKERANIWLEKRMGSVAIAIDAQYKRIRVLRNALSTIRVTLPTPGSQNTTSGTENPNGSLKLALVYLRQWIQFKEHQEHDQRQKDCKSWKFNQDHERILIKHVFEIDEFSEDDMVAFYQYVPHLKGFVRSRLWEHAQDTRKKDDEAGAAAVSEGNQEQMEKYEDQKQYEIELARFLEDQKQRQTARSPKERLFTNVEVFHGGNLDGNIEKRLNKRVRVEQVLEVLASSEQTVVKTLSDSGLAWRASQRFKDGITLVRQWKEENPESPPDSAGKDGNNDGPVAQSSISIHSDQLCDSARLLRKNENDRHSHLSATTIQDDEPERTEVRALARQQRTKKNGLEKGQDTSNSCNDGATVKTDEDCGEYELEKDVNAYLIQFKVKQEVDQTNRQPETFLEQHEEPLTDGRFKGTFPDQRISMSLLLDNDFSGGSKTDKIPKGKSNDAKQIARNILSRNQCKSQDGSEKIRYFHIPSNNMEWVEQAIANYYETEKPDLSRKLRHQRVQTPTHLLLSPQYWRGQQQGTRSGVVHARHMRSLCEVVSTDINEMEKHPKNIVLFMPYLHWETDRRRETISRLIDIESNKFRQKQRQDKLDSKRIRQEKRKRLTLLSKDIERWKIKHPKEGAEDSASQNRLLQTIDLALHQFLRRRREVRRGERPYIDDSGRLRVNSALGQYLVDAARLYEAMSTFRDQRMLEKYLFHDPPLHPRRTLDQSYYWTLRTTKARDRDQVIYRDTKLDFVHELQETEKPKHSLWSKIHRSSQHDSTRATSSITSTIMEDPAPIPEDSDTAQYAGDDVSPPMRWKHHSETTDEQGCDQCKSDIKKVSQLIMVDQLWMWVLDEHTIITSFPRRYGSNKHDLSGVHRSIRARLKSFRKNDVRSVYDLALIILDECSNTFFDRTRTDEGQPQVMDIFSEAIGRVTNQHTISFQHVWHWTQEASKIYRARSKYVSSANLHVSLLDINPEGKLQREVKDILDELDIMLHVHKRQRDIMKRFRRHVEHILDPKNQWSGDCFTDEDTSEPSRKQPGNANVRSGGNGKSEEQPGIDNEETRRRKQLGWFRIQYQELLSEVNDRIDELEGLRAGAKSTADSVNDLLALKQQQASVVQAWESVRQAEEAVTQGRAVMMFTIVTIVFLPLSFMSSIFGMNNWEFTDSGPMHLGEQFKLMFSISIGIIIATIVVAFSPLLRATVVSLTKYIFTVVVVYSQLYRFWIAFHDEYGSQSLMRKTELKVRHMKEEVRKAKRKRAARRAELLNQQNNPDEQASGVANTTSFKSKWGWFNRFFGAGSTQTPESKPASILMSTRDGNPEDRETNGRSEQSSLRPPSTGSNGSTQVHTMVGGNTPTSRGARTPEPPLMGGRNVDDGDIV